MSFYSERDKNALLFRQRDRERYEAFFQFESRDDICRGLDEMMKMHLTGFSARSQYPIHTPELIGSMNVILSAIGHGEATPRSINSIFSLKRQKGAGELVPPRSTKISRKYRYNRLYVERRYWDQAETMAFCIAARLTEQEAEKIIVPMMGQPWRYLRDPYMLVTDYALNRGLTAEQTATLLKDTMRVLKNREPSRMGQLMELEEMTRQISNNYSEELKNRPMDTPEQAMERFMHFVKKESGNMKGSFQRTTGIIQKLIQFEGWPEKEIEADADFAFYFCLPEYERDADSITVLKHLAKSLAMTFVPWEAKGRVQPEEHRENWQLLATGARKETVVYERLRDYMAPSRCSEMRYADMRSDLLRLLLIYRVTDIRQINRWLTELSFLELNPQLPFDFFVLAAIAFGTGQRVNNRGGDPYRVLAELMEYYTRYKEDGK